MRKHSVRKWIHAICDLLPLLVIPIFALAVRSDNNYQPIEVNYGGGYEVNIAYSTEDPTSNNSLKPNLIYHVDELDFDSFSITDNGVDTSFGLYIFSINSISYDNNSFVEPQRLETAVTSYDCNSYNYLALDFTFSTSTHVSILSYFTNANCYDLIDYNNEDDDFTLSLFEVDFVVYYGINEFNLFLEDMYNGYGFEPTFTSSDFKVLDVTYNEGVVYNDTDVGSQMMYTLYQTTDKYFNFNNVGVFQDLYNWFETNMFHGTAPMSFYIVWNVILFEFIMDLIFLTYMVFMFIIDFTECMIDRFFEKSYRGGR